MRTPGRPGTWFAAATAYLLMAGCASTRVTMTPRSGIEQQLLVRSLERAVAQLDLDRFAGKRVALELFALTADQGFARPFVTAHLERRGLEVVAEPGQADLRLRIFAPVLGVDRNDLFVGTPAAVAPLVPIPIPELALFKRVRHRGHSEVEIFAFDARTERFIGATPAAVGRATFDEYTILLLLSFTHDDLEERPASPGR